MLELVDVPTTVLIRVGGVYNNRVTYDDITRYIVRYLFGYLTSSIILGGTDRKDNCNTVNCIRLSRFIRSDDMRD